MRLLLPLPQVIVLLICSPTLSIIGLATGFYFPNDKLAFFALVFLHFFGNLKFKSSRENFSFIVLSNITFLFTFLTFLLRGFLFSIFPSGSDLNHILSIYETLTFALYFTTLDLPTIFSSLGFATFVNVFAALLQTLLILFGRPELTLLFSNYPAKVSSEYIPQIGGVLRFLPRVYGLFHEASSLSVLCSLALLITILSFLLKKKTTFLNPLTLYLADKPGYSLFVCTSAFLGIILTYSLTGLLSLFIPLIYFFICSLASTLRSALSKNTLSLLFITISLLVVFYDQTVHFLLWTLTKSDRHEATVAVLQRLYMSSFPSFLLGNSLLSSSDLSWDVWTRLFDTLGLLAAPSNYLWYLFIIFYRVTPFTLFALAQSLTGGSLSAAQSLITLSIVWYINSTKASAV